MYRQSRESTILPERLLASHLQTLTTTVGWTFLLLTIACVSRSTTTKETARLKTSAIFAGAGYDENGKSFAGMGVDAADYDNDGWPDLIITTLSNERYPLYRNNKDLSFTWATNVTAVGQITLLYSGWGTKFIDADNDGWRDIFVAQGHVLDTIEKTTSYLKYKQTPLLMLNTGKAFVNVSEYGWQWLQRTCCGTWSGIRGFE
jgi:hypothetical protein